MAAITSFATGDWHTGATWVGGVAPIAGDTVVIAINHIITANANVDIGASNGQWVSGGNAAALQFTGVATPGKLVLAAGVSLTLRGDLINSNSTSGSTTRIFEAGAGCQLIFDSSLDTAGVSYRCGAPANNYRSSRFQMVGTSDNKCRIRSVTGGTGGKSRLGAGAFTEGCGLELTWADVEDMGDATNAGWYDTVGSSTNAGHISYLRNVRFIRCGGVRIESISQIGVFDWQDVDFSDSQALYSFSVNANTVATTSTRRLVRVGADKIVGMLGGANPQGVWQQFVIDDCVFLAGMSSVGGASFPSANAATSVRNSLLVMAPGSSATSMPEFGWVHAPTHLLEDVHAYMEGHAANRKFVTFPYNASATHRRTVIEGGAWIDAYQHDAIYVAVTGAAITRRVERCLVVPNAMGGTTAVPGHLEDADGSPGFMEVENCTFMLRDTLGSDWGSYNGGEGGKMLAGVVSKFRNNLFWHSVAQRCGKFLDYRQGALGTNDTPTDPIAPADADYNAMHNGLAVNANSFAAYWNATAGGNKNGYAARFSADPGTHDVDVLHPDWTGPAFVDPTRSLPEFDIRYLSGVLGMAEHAAKTAWASGQAYVAGDEVSVTWPTLYGGRPVNFRCIAAHTSGNYTKPNAMTCVTVTPPGTHGTLTTSGASLQVTLVAIGTLAGLAIDNKRLAIPTNVVSGGANFPHAPANQTSYAYIVATAWSGEDITAYEVQWLAADTPPENSWKLATVVTDGTGVTSCTNTVTTNYGVGRESPFWSYWRLRSPQVCKEALRDGLAIGGKPYHQVAREWVQGGFAPTSTLLRAAGYDGSDIGAVAFVSAASRRRRIFRRGLL